MSKFDGLVKSLEEKANKEPEITNDGGLGDIGKEIQSLVESGELEKLSNTELMRYYLRIVELSGNQKLITATKISLTKKKRPDLIKLVKNAANMAERFSKND